MRQIRLLPVVIFAAIALLLFKGVGLLTSGGYVLTGTTEVSAATEEPASGGDVTMAVPAETTMNDTSPVLDDHAPTLATKEEAPAGHGDTAEPAAEGGGEHGAPAAETTPAAAAADTTAAAAPPDPKAAAPAGEAHPDAPADTASAATDCAAAPAAAAAGGEAPAEGHADAVAVDAAAAPCGADPHAEGIPMIKTSAGDIVPLATPLTADALLQRLAERRAELDTRDGELQLRASLVEAAEKRLEERKAELEALEARINALVEEKKTMEDSQFKALVGMYETMKPADAAKIFDQLDMTLMVRLARAMNPRKMAPILAKMNATSAQTLTQQIAAADTVDTTIDVASPDIASLPQIVGK